MGIIADLETKINGYIKSNPKFQKATAEAFAKADKNKDGKITCDEASKAVDAILEGVEDDLDNWGITLDKKLPVEEYVKAYDTNNDGVLDKAEFEDFYRKVIVISAVRASSSIIKRYGSAMILGTLFVYAINETVKNQTDEEKNLPTWATFLIGPAVGVTTLKIVDVTDITGSEGANKDYVKDNGKATASSDPAAPTPFLKKAEADKKEKKRKSWFGRKKN